MAKKKCPQHGLSYEIGASCPSCAWSEAAPDSKGDTRYAFGPQRPQSNPRHKQNQQHQAQPRPQEPSPFFNQEKSEQQPAPAEPGNYEERGIFVQMIGRVCSDVQHREVSGRVHFIDWLPVLCLGLVFLAMLPALLVAAQMVMMMIAFFIAVPLVFNALFPQLPLFRSLSMFRPRMSGLGRGSAKSSLMQTFRVRTPEGVERDVVLVGPHMQIQLGDELKVSAVRTHGPLQALLVRNRNSSSLMIRKGIIASGVAVVVWIFVLVSMVL